MDEYIKREDALKAVSYAGPRERASLVDVALMVAYTKINRIPAVDAVEVTRCKDCVYKTVTIDGEYDTHDIVCGYFMSDGFDGNDFCSYGKKENE